VASVRLFDGGGVVLADGTRIEPDVVIAATGYRRGLESLVGHLGVLDGQGRPVSNGVPSATAGLWFAGYEEPLIGPMRSFRLQASAIARDIVCYLDAAS
jgi:putative flavoprotein involved in K+ transport